MLNQEWLNAKKVTAEHSKSKWMKINSSDEVIVAFQGVPFMFCAHWKDHKRVPCEARDCEHCKAEYQSKVRCAVNVVVENSVGYSSHILETSKAVFQNISECVFEHGLDHWFKIRRTGVGLDTNYRVIPIGDLNEFQLDEVRAVKLFDLQEIYHDMGYREHVSDRPHC